MTVEPHCPRSDNRSPSRERKRHRDFSIAALIALTTLQPVLQAASSLPAGGTFAAGAGNISTSGNILNINQSTLRGIIDWNTFSIGNGASVNFKNGAGATLNRVTGGAATTILGQLLASGSVYILNSQGVLIGHGATVHTGGDFLAGTLNISNSAFLTGGNLLFGGPSGATVINLGNVSSSGGSVYLIGHSVQNGGVISTPAGTTGLAAGGQVLIADSANDQRVFVQAPGGDVTNSGYINAAQAELRSNGGNIYALAGNNGGQIRATGTATQGGHVWLVAENGTSNVSGLISAVNANGSGGNIETSGAHVVTNGATITTGKGGDWLLDPNDLTIDSGLATTIETSLNDYTNVTEITSNSGNITVASNIAWSSYANLTLSAGGNVAINNAVTISNSGSGSLTLRADNGSIGTGAVNINGLVDFSGSSGTVSVLYDPLGAASTKYTTPTVYNASPSGTQVKTNGSVANQFTGYMLVNNVTDLQNINTNLTGTYAVGQPFSTSGNFTQLASGSSFTGILDGFSQTITGLTITSPPSANDGLFSEIGSSGIVRNLTLASVNIVGPSCGSCYVGAIAGWNTGTIANSSSSGTISGGSGANLSLGGLVGKNDGTIQNSSSSASVTGPSTSVNVGGLVGNNTGTISNSRASGAVTTSASSANLGGLVGLSTGAVSNSSASGAVTATGGGNFSNSPVIYSNVGGLAGFTGTGGTITGSSASGAVSGLYYSNIGGLVGSTGALIGSAGASISSSSASGNVTASSNFSNVGGLAGFTGTSGTITGSSASGTVSGISQSNIGGLVGYATASITGSSASGNVTHSIGDSSIGGLVGKSSANIDTSYATGSVSSTDCDTGDTEGGLVGTETGAAVTNSFAMGSVTDGGGTDTSIAGGLIGNNSAALSDTYARGAVSVGVDSTAVGGLVGLNSSSATITRSYSSGPVTYESNPPSSIGGFIGSNLGTGNITFSYWDKNTSGFPAIGVGTGNSGGLTGETTLLLKSDGIPAGSMPAGFNANNTFWVAPDEVYPYLAWQGITPINGTVYNGPNVIPNATVSAMSGGSLLFANKLTATSNGYYSSSEPTDMHLTGTGVLTYLTSGGLNANTYFDSGYSGGRYAGMDLHVNALRLFNESSGTLSGLVANLLNASGSTANANYLFTFPGNGSLTPTVGTSTSILSSPSFTIDRPLTTPTTTTIQSYGNLTIADGDPVNQGSATTLTMIAGSRFYNQDGSSALSTSGGNWLVYSQSPAYDTTGGLVPAFKQYAGYYGETVLAHTGNGLLYSVAPVVSETLTGALTKVYDGTTAITLSPSNYGSKSGVLAGDTVTLTTPTTGAYFSKNVNNAIGVNATGVSIFSETAAYGDSTVPVYGYQLGSVSGSIGSITPAVLTYNASAANRLYGSVNPTFTGTVTGFVNNESLTSATSGTAAFFSEFGPTTNVGNYAIFGNNLTANNGNYTFLQAASNSTALTINPALLTYNANPASQTYGSANTTFSGTVTGFVNSDTLANATTGTKLFTSATSATANVGHYGITGSGVTANNGNYTFFQAESNGSALNIYPAFLTYNANATSQPYGSANNIFTGSVSGFLNSDTLANATSGTKLFTSATSATTNVGHYGISGSGLIANNGNYTFLQGESNGNALNIYAAFLTYNATATSQTYGSANNTFTGTVTGFLNSDNLANATSGPAVFTSAISATSNVGHYGVFGSGLTANNGNYTFLQAEANGNALTINPALLTYTATAASQLYGSPNSTFTGAVTGFVNNQTLAVTTGTAAFASETSATTNVGNYDIFGYGLTANHGNYTFAQAEANGNALAINPAYLTYNATPASQTYGSPNSIFTGAVTGFVNTDTLSNATMGTAAFASETSATTNVGHYGISGSGVTANHGNYIFEQAETNPSALTINPALLTYTATPASQLYGSPNNIFAGAVTGFVNSETLAVTTGTAAFTSETGAATNVGHYGINASGLTANFGNYTFAYAPGNSTALTINPALLTYTATPANQLYGSPNSTFTGAVTGFVNNQTLANATTGTTVFASETGAGTNVGSYGIYGSGPVANHGNYTFEQAEGNINALTINPAYLTYTATPASQTYGSPNSTFTGAVTGFVNTDTLSNATMGTAAFASETSATTNVGHYGISGSGVTANHGNYIFEQAESNPSALTINPALLTYTATPANQLYGSPNSTFTGIVTGFVNGETLAVTTGTPAFTSETAATTNVGGYGIYGSGLTANNGNYTFLQAESNGNALTINPALLTYTADASNRIYGSPNGVFTGNVTGFVNTDTLTSATTGTAGFATAATPAANVGSYAVNGSGLTAAYGNYIFAQAAGNASAFTINPALLTYTANPGGRTYGAADPTYTGTVSGFVNGDTADAATAGSLAFTTPALVTSNVGSYAINGSGLTANYGNYTFAQAPASASALTISPALLTYTANPGNRTYGATDPIYTGTVSGFVNGETPATATSGTAAFTTPALATSNVGSYAINGSGLAANFGNYTFTQASDNSSALTINPALLTYTASSASRLNGSVNPPLTGSVTGFVNNESLASATTGSAVFSTPATPASPVGMYAIDGSGLGANNGNYTFAQAAGNSSALTINNAALTLLITNTTRLQNQPNPSFIATYSGPAIDGLNVPSLLAGLTFQTSASSTSPAGSYQVTASAIVPPGFIINIVPGTLTVIQDSPQTVPSQILSPTTVLPVLLAPPAAVAGSFLQPSNSLGLFQIIVAGTNNTFGTTFTTFAPEQTPLSQSSIFGNSSDQSTTYTAGAKPQ